jgi:hypothetical protein
MNMRILAAIALSGWILSGLFYMGIIDRGYDVSVTAFNEKGYTPEELDAMDKLTQVYGN